MATTAYLFAPPADAEVIHGLKICRKPVEFGPYAGQPAVQIWRGKAQKPYANYRFKTEAGREEYIAKQVADAKQAEEQKAAEKAKKVAFVHNLKVGSIIYHSWGYDQTNIDFYQVVRLIGKTQVALRRIKGQMHANDGGSPMSGQVSALKDQFSETNTEEIIKKVSPGYRGSDSVYINFKYGCGSETTPEQKHYCSWYA